MPKICSNFAEKPAKMNPNSLVSISDLTKEQMLSLLELARYFEIGRASCRERVFILV